MIDKFFYEYAKAYQEAMSTLDLKNLEYAINTIKAAYIHTKSKIYVGGNGGSAAISNHLCCDFIKGANLKTISLSCNTPLITAIGNDFGYQYTLSYQLEKLANNRDVLILISSSGNSPNIVEAINAAKKIGCKVIGLSGFSGGYLKENCDISLHININNYGVVEDCHQSLMHIISQYIRGDKNVSK